MSADLRQQVIAFAGILQAGELVRQIATGGQCSQQSARACIESVFANEPESTEAVFGGLPGVRLGLTMANELAASASNDARQAMGYAGGLMRLSMFLRKDPSRLDDLGRALNLVEAAWRDAGDVLDPSVIAQLADVYRQQISTLPLRIQVHGNPQYLKAAAPGVCCSSAAACSGSRPNCPADSPHLTEARSQATAGRRAAAC
jgi:high frequency lysogenization protein